MKFPRRDIPQASISVVKWTPKYLGMRVTLNGPLLDKLGWSRKTNVSHSTKGQWLTLKPHHLGNRLHMRGAGPALSFVTMSLPEGIADVCYSQITNVIIQPGYIRIKIPEDFFAQNKRPVLRRSN